MSLQIRRGTAAEVASITPDLAEPIYVTDTEALVIGDGVTQGGNIISANLQSLDISQITESGHSVTQLYDENSTGTIRLANLTNDYSLTVGPDGTLVTGPLSVSSTATFAGNIDGTEGYTANMTGFRAGYYGGTGGFAFKDDPTTGMFGWGANDLRLRADGTDVVLIDSGAIRVDRINATEIYANDTTQDLSLTANFNGAGSGAGGSVNLFSANGSNAAAKVEVLGDTIDFKSADASVTYGSFGFDTGLNVTTTATVATLKFGDGTTMTTAAGGGGGSTNTFVTAFVDRELSIGTGTYRMLLGQSTSGFDNQFYITGNDQVNDKLFFDQFNLVQINSGNQLQVESTATFNGNVNVNVNNTMTVAGMTIGVSNNVLIPNQITSSATNVLVQTPPTNGGAIIFNMNRFGVQRPLAITRTGGIAFDFGQLISPGQGANVGQLLVQAASTSTGTANTLFLTSGGITGSGPLSRGVFSDASGFTIGTRPSGGATAFNSSVFDLNGGLTLPKSLAVGTTATVATTMILPVYTVAGLTAITGVIGSVAIVSDSGGGGGNVNGMMAFWDTTNNRWSYVHDNNAV